MNDRIICNLQITNYGKCLMMNDRNNDKLRITGLILLDVFLIPSCMCVSLKKMIAVLNSLFVIRNLEFIIYNS